VAGHLTRSLVALLHAGSHEDAPETRRGHGCSDRQSRKVLTDVFDDSSPRKGASPPGWNLPSQASLRASARPVAREPSVLLAAFHLGDSFEACDSGRCHRTTFDLANGHRIRPGAHNYMDQALTPVSDDGDETLDLLTKTTGARAAVAHVKKIARLTSARV
jgi:hypothetical protein